MAQQLQEIFGVSAEKARNMLDAAGGSVEMAIDLFSGGGVPAPHPVPAPAPTPAADVPPREKGALDDFLRQPWQPLQVSIDRGNRRLIQRCGPRNESPPRPAVDVPPRPAVDSPRPAMSSVRFRVFWDFANMRVYPTDNVDAGDFMARLEKALFKALGMAETIVSWRGSVIYHNEHTFTPQFPEPRAFTQRLLGNYSFTKTETGPKQGTDDSKVKEDLKAFAEKEEGIAVLIASDKDYQNVLREYFIEKGRPFAVVYQKDLASPDYIRQMKQTVEWGEVLSRSQCSGASGRLMSWNKNRGFGFIKAKDGEVYFYHQKDMAVHHSFEKGVELEFSPVPSTSSSKRAEARRVAPLLPPSSTPAASPRPVGRPREPTEGLTPEQSSRREQGRSRVEAHRAREKLAVKEEEAAKEGKQEVKFREFVIEKKAGERMGMRLRGPFIVDVWPGTAAEKAGMWKGTGAIVNINGTAIGDEDGEVGRVLSTMGSTLRIRVDLTAKPPVREDSPRPEGQAPGSLSSDIDAWLASSDPFAQTPLQDDAVQAMQREPPAAKPVPRRKKPPATQPPPKRQKQETPPQTTPSTPGTPAARGGEGGADTGGVAAKQGSTWQPPSNFNFGGVDGSSAPPSKFGGFQVGALKKAPIDLAAAFGKSAPPAAAQEGKQEAKFGDEDGEVRRVLSTANEIGGGTAVKDDLQSLLRRAIRLDAGSRPQGARERLSAVLKEYIQDTEDD